VPLEGLAKGLWKRRDWHFSTGPFPALLAGAADCRSADPPPKRARYVSLRFACRCRRQGPHPGHGEVSAPQPPTLQWITFAIAALGTIGTLAGIWLTNHFNGRRQKRERLWDLKREAYANLIEAYEENRYLQKIIKSIDWTDRKAAVARVEAMGEQVNGERRKLRSVRSRNAFIVGDKAREAIRAFHAKHEEWDQLLDQPDADYEAYFVRSRQAFSEIVDQLQDAAREELA